MRRSEMVEVLGDVPLFATLNKRQLGQLAKSARVIQVDAGEVMMEEGTPGDLCMVILDGTASVQRAGAALGRIGEGAVIGEMAIVDGGPRSATVRMDTPGTVLGIGRRAFAEVVYSSPAMASKVMVQLAARLRSADPTLYG